MSSQLNCIQRLKHNKQSRKFSKHGGYAWIGGIFIVLLIFVLTAFVYQRYKWLYEEQDIEDTVTSSALGSLIADEYRYSITRDILLRDEDEAYETLCQLTAENFGLTRVGTNEYTGEHPYFATDIQNCKVDKAVFYDVCDSTGQTDIYTYTATSGGSYNKTTSTRTTADGITTPNDLPVNRTSCYMVFEFPIRVMGIPHVVHKGTYVTLEPNFDWATDVTEAEEEPTYQGTVVAHYGNYTKTFTVPISVAEHRYAEDYIDAGLPAEAVASDPTLAGYSFVGWVGQDKLLRSNKLSNGTITNLCGVGGYRTNKTFVGSTGRTVHIYAVLSKNLTYTVNYRADTSPATVKKPTSGYPQGSVASNTISTVTYRISNTYSTFIKQKNGVNYNRWESPYIYTAYNTFLQSPANSYYTFVNWACSTGGYYNQNQLYQFSPLSPNVTFYARWTPVVWTCTVNCNGGSGVSSFNYSVETTTVTIPVPSRSYYTFAGWTVTGPPNNTLRAGVDYIVPGTGTQSFSGTGNTTFNNAHNNFTLTARWTPIVYSISVNCNGGSAGVPSGWSGNIYSMYRTFTVETPAFRLPSPSRANYNFTGWSGVPAGVQNALGGYVYPGVPNGYVHYNVALTANWQEAYWYGTAYFVESCVGTQGGHGECWPMLNWNGGVSSGGTAYGRIHPNARLSINVISHSAGGGEHISTFSNGTGTGYQCFWEAGHEHGFSMTCYITVSPP